MLDKKSERKIETRKYFIDLNICQCGVGTFMPDKTRPDYYQNTGVVLTWVLKGDGIFQQDGRDYKISDNCVCLRNPRIPYRMELYTDEGPRLFVIISMELYNFLELQIPELAQMPPVWNFEYSQEAFDAFMAMYDHMAKLTFMEFYRVIPELIQFILLITNIQYARSKDPLELGKRFLDDNHVLKLEEIAEKCGMPYNTFRKRFAEKYGISPGQYRIRRRIDSAAQWLERGASVSETAEMMGYPDIYNFSRQFKDVTGTAPSRYKASDSSDLHGG